MDSAIYKKIMTIGGILACPKNDRFPLLQGYISTNHTAAYELALILNSNKNWPNSRASLGAALEAWLTTNDKAWRLAVSAANAAKTVQGDDWEDLAEILEISPQTAKQAIQALRRGGWNSSASRD